MWDYVAYFALHSENYLALVSEIQTSLEKVKAHNPFL